MASTSAAALVAEEEEEEDAGGERYGSDGGSDGAEMADEAEIAVRALLCLSGPRLTPDAFQAVFDMSTKKGKGGKGGFRDEQFYMSHYQKDADTEKGFVVPFPHTHNI